MQDIATKLSRIATVAKAAGLSTDQARHLIHGTGGSPRRAKRAIRLGIHDQLISAYTAALADNGSHATATVACNKLWADLVPSTPADAGEDGDLTGGQPAELNDDVGPTHETVPEPATYPAARRRRFAAATTAAAELRELLPA